MISHEQAHAARKMAEDEFVMLCRRGREQPVDLQEFADNRVKFLQANEAVWDSMLRAIDGTGVQVYVS